MARCHLNWRSKTDKIHTSFSNLRHKFVFSKNAQKQLQWIVHVKRNAMQQTRSELLLWLFCHNFIKMAVWIRVQLMRQWNIFHSKGAKSRSSGDSRGMLLLTRTYEWNLRPKRKGIWAKNPSTVNKVWLQPFNIRHYHRVAPCAHCQKRRWFLYRPWVRCVKEDGWWRPLKEHYRDNHWGSICQPRESMDHLFLCDKDATYASINELNPLQLIE